MSTDFLHFSQSYNNCAIACADIVGVEGIDQIEEFRAARDPVRNAQPLLKLGGQMKNRRLRFILL